MGTLRASWCRGCLAFGLIGLICSPAVLAYDITFTRMVSTGDTAPGDFGTYLFFLSPSYSNGQLAFIGTNSGFGTGVFTTDGTSTNKLADQSTLFPGTSNPFIDFSGTPVISSGQVVFVSRFGATVGESGLFTAPFAGGPLQVLAEGTTPVPGGSGFMSPIFQPSLSNGNAVFWDRGTNLDSEGIYLADAGGVSVVVNLSTPVPGGGSFLSLGVTPSISGSSVAFLASTIPSFDQAIYLATGGVLNSIASLATAIPGGTGAFTQFLDPVLSGQELAFLGFGDNGQQGIYAWVNGALRVIADLQTQVPGGSNPFASFLNGSVSVSPEGLVFVGTDTGGNFGAYFSDFTTGLLTKVIASGDQLDGHVLGLPLLGYQALDGREVAFNALFNDFTSGLYVARIGPSAVVPEPSTLILALIGLPLGVAAWIRRTGATRSVVT